jgi:hypothetical protein
MHHQLGILGQVSVDPGKQHAFVHGFRHHALRFSPCFSNSRLTASSPNACVEVSESNASCRICFQAIGSRYIDRTRFPARLGGRPVTDFGASRGGMVSAIGASAVSACLTAAARVDLRVRPAVVTVPLLTALDPAQPAWCD